MSVEASPPSPPLLGAPVEISKTVPPPPPPQPPIQESTSKNGDSLQSQSKTNTVPDVETNAARPSKDEEVKVYFDDDAELVPTEFVWSEDYANTAKEVKVSGTWNGWLPIDMFHESEGVWSVITKVPVGTHEFKFIIDGEWTVSAMHPATDGGGDPERINNVRVVSGKPNNELPKHSIYQSMKKNPCCVIV